MQADIIVNQVIILFIILLIGFYVRKRDIITANMTSKLSELLLQVTQPFLIISSFDSEFTRETLRSALFIIIFSTLIHLFSMLVAKFIYIRYEKNARDVLKFVTVFSNCAFMGFPILHSLLGSKGVFYGALYTIPFNVLALPYGMVIFSGERDRNTFRNVLTHPIIISVVVGMVLFLLKVQLPEPVSEAISLTGSMTTPLSMLIIGSLLADVPLRGMLRGKEIYLGSFIRLIAMPLLVYGLMRLLPIPKEVLHICVILTAMPASVNTAILSKKYGGDALLASRFISITTIFSMFTIPLIMMLL